MNKNPLMLTDTLMLCIAEMRETLADIDALYKQRYASAPVVLDVQHRLLDFERAVTTLRRAVRDWK